MKGFYVTAQCSQDISDTGWHTVGVYAEDKFAALEKFNQQAVETPGWLRASIECVVESRTHGNPVVSG
jgi:uncharacterized protein (DUF2237 family)